MRPGGQQETGSRKLRSGAAIVLVVLAFLTIGTGVYFMALRPPLLPEDLRFAGLDQGAVPHALHPWLSIVFRTLGGFVVGLGLCILGHGAYWLTNRPIWLALGTGLGLIVAFGSFLASNIQLSSDFLWFIALLFVGAFLSAVLLLASWRRERREGS